MVFSSSRFYCRRCGLTLEGSAEPGKASRAGEARGTPRVSAAHSIGPRPPSARAGFPRDGIHDRRTFGG
ncbi:MAG: hypothetical protein IT338_07610 [Thermomicrobiales bacterium]|nr:hypothetical protein [Thermomicrobiales bacterium]